MFNIINTRLQMSVYLFFNENNLPNFEGNIISDINK